MTVNDGLRQRAQLRRLHGLLAHWSEINDTAWLPQLLQWEEQEHSRRSLNRRLKDSHLGRFKSLSDFDWRWPKRCNRAAIEALMDLDFLTDAINVILIGPHEPVTLCTS